jgi:hypothetical protein
MRAQRFWLIGSMVAVALTACGDDDTAASDPETQAAMALSRAMHFTGGELRDGAMGLATEDRVELVLESEQVVHPGEAGLMPLEVDNPIEDDNAGAAVLMQFADADQHVRVPTKKSVDGPGDLNFEFSIDDSVCNGLCATTIDVPITLALELDDGDIGKHEKTSIKVDCSKKGSKAACNSGNPGSGGKAGSSGGSRDSGADLPSSGGRDGGVSISPGATAAVQDLLDAVDDLDNEVCSCIPGSDGNSCLDAVSAERPCNEAVLEAFAEGNEELLACTRDFFVDQTSCITDAACDSTKLEACTASTSMSGDWTEIEAACGTVPAGLRQGIDACGQTSPSPSSCLDGTAIDSSDFCDGVEDCPDGSDETGCSPGNPGDRPTSFPCGSSTISLDKVCDGTMDCSGGYDEMVCVACSDDSAMYSPFDLCDGKDRCADGSDEANCEYPCVGGGSINLFLVCNGTPDCADGSDESFCNGNGFTCPDGMQIPIMSVCDGTADCSDGGDESQALCGSM